MQRAQPLVYIEPTQRTPEGSEDFGQCVYFLMTSRPGQLILLGRGLMIVYIIASSVIALVGAAVGAGVRHRWG